MVPLPKSPRHALLQRIAIDLAVMTGIGVFLAILGPFGSIAAPFAERLVTWLGFASLGYACYRPMQTVVNSGEGALALPRWGLLAATCRVATAPMTCAVIAMHSLGAGARCWRALDIWVGTYFSVLVIGGAVTVLFNVVQGQPGAGLSGVSSPLPATPSAGMDVSPPLLAPAPAASANPLFDQLPPERGSAIVALEMEDRYVRVHTMLELALVLMRMRDAVALLGDLEGMQAHRSWWVARGAVEDVLREGRKVRFRLARGIEAPVARANIATLREARWI
jgi:hypothetical protein